MAVPIIRAGLAALQFATKVIKPRTLGQKKVKKAVEAQGNYAKGQAKAGTASAAVIGVGDYIFDDVSKNEIPEIKKQAKEDNIEIKVYDKRIDPKDYPTYKKDSASAKSFRERQKEAKKVEAMFFSWEGRIYNTKEKRTEKYSGGLLSDDKDRIGYQDGTEVEVEDTTVDKRIASVVKTYIDVANADSTTLEKVFGKGYNYDSLTLDAKSIAKGSNTTADKVLETMLNQLNEQGYREYDPVKKPDESRDPKYGGGMLSDDKNRMAYAEGEEVGTHTMPDGTEMVGSTHAEYEEELDKVSNEETDMSMPAEEMSMPAEEMAMVPDGEMEQDHLDFIINESLDAEEEAYLMEMLQADDRLSTIFDKVMDTASEFSGDGPVEGLGSEVSDSIPARLSDGEFVMTAQATDEIGSDNLQNMMDSAEEVSDDRQQVAMGGNIEDESQVDQFGKPLDEDLADEEIRRSMLSVNPRLR